MPDNTFIPEDCDLEERHIYFFDLAKQPAYEGRMFDVVLCTEVVEHIFADDTAIFANLSNIVKPGGFLILSVPNAVSLVRRLTVLFGKNNITQKKNIIRGTFGGYGHIREYAMYEVELYMGAYFDIVYSAGINEYPSTQRLPFNRFLPTSLCDDMLFIGKRNLG